MEFFSKSGKAKMSSKISNVDLLLAHSNYPVITFLENPLLVVEKMASARTRTYYSRTPKNVKFT